ncbi:MAG: YdbL family protein, partial [Lysobacterales bacterium]
MRKPGFLLLLCSLVIAACVTINVYFPAAAAEKAAEEFVGDVLGEPHTDGSLFLPADLESEPVLFAANAVLDFLVPSAAAQQPEIDINTPQINAIKEGMAKRQRDTLNALFDSGAIGFTSDGLVAIRDRAAV